MKFGKEMLEESREEWKDKYINYLALKRKVSLLLMMMMMLMPCPWFPTGCCSRSSPPPLRAPLRGLKACLRACAATHRRCLSCKR